MNNLFVNTDEQLENSEPDKAFREQPAHSISSEKIKLRDNKKSAIFNAANMLLTKPNGQSLTIQEFANLLLEKLPEFFNSKKELRNNWSDPLKRKALLEQLNEAGVTTETLAGLQKALNAENSDLLDVLEFILYSQKPMTRITRVKKARKIIFVTLDTNQTEFIEHVLRRYVENGSQELSQDNLPELLEIKYYSILNAADILGGVPKIVELFVGFQKHLYQHNVA